ncbi:MAG: hypothetical protein ACYDHW_07535 [Syntrophorhabdaceae bacterium]
MKKGPRCPVCGSLQIKIAGIANSTDDRSETGKHENDLKIKSSWKCYDCYRTFDKPDESA